MAKQKSICHICGNLMKTAKGEEVPQNCTICGADLLNPTSETRTHRTVVQHEAGGVKANLVEILLTDIRIIFKEDGMSGAAGAGLIGGAIGGAIAGAVSKKSNKFNSIALTDFVSINEKIVGLLKNKVELAIHAKDGDVYSFVLSKKEMEQWRPGLFKYVQ